MPKPAWPHTCWSPASLAPSLMTPPSPHAHTSACPACRKEALGPFIAAEAQELHKEAKTFAAAVEAFRKKFLDVAPMSSSAPLLPATVGMVLGRFVWGEWEKAV